MSSQNTLRLSFSPLLDRVRAALARAQRVYLVGGAVRDALLQQETHDLDFAMPGDALKIAARLADTLGGAYYPLDDEHHTGRIVLIQADKTRFILDFASFRGPDLESDLRARDFTINAVAMDIHAPGQLIDPLGGVRDLQQGQVRACSPVSFDQDPLRILRAVRMATAFKFHILPETRTQMRQAAHRLTEISPERIRDELFRILGGRMPAAAFQALDLLGLLPRLLSELEPLKDLAQPKPHISDAWTHTLRTLDKLEVLANVLGPVYDPEAAADMALGMAVHRLGRYRLQISDHLSTPLTADRPLHPLLFLAALYHDAGKPQTAAVDEAGRIRFYEHPQVGAKIGARRARRLRLSNLEVNRLSTVIRHHMRPLLLAQKGAAPSRRAIYRFFRDTGSAGVDVCLLSLADMLATYGPTLPQETWSSLLTVVRALMDAWWENRQDQVHPQPLLRGDELLTSLDLTPGPEVGRLLEALREAQACGKINTREGALSFARQWLAGRNLPQE